MESKVNLILFGSTGMLGNYVYNYFKQYFNIICINRDKFDILKNSFTDLDFLLHKFPVGSIIINCIGLIPQSGNSSDCDYIKINSIFPKYLSLLCSKNTFHLLHITTDCVFSGNKPKHSSYSETSEHDEIGIYGLSKSLGEFGTIIRTSIIGEQTNKRYLSLLEWLKKNSGKHVFGYTNYYWNGMTCLQLCKIIHEIIKTKNFYKGVRHFYSNTVSKYELLQLINDSFNLQVTIIPKECEIQINKTLSSIKQNLNIIIPSLDIQLKELKELQN